MVLELGLKGSKRWLESEKASQLLLSWEDAESISIAAAAVVVLIVWEKEIYPRLDGLFGKLRLLVLAEFKCVTM